MVTREMALRREVRCGRLAARVRLPIKVRLVGFYSGVMVMVVVVVVVVDVLLGAAGHNGGAAHLRLNLFVRGRTGDLREPIERAEPSDRFADWLRRVYLAAAAGSINRLLLLLLLLLLLTSRCGRLLLLAAAYYAGTDAAGLIEPVQYFRNAAVGHLQLAAYLARPSALLRQLDYELPLEHWQRPAVDEGAAQLIAPALAMPNHGARQWLLLLLVMVLVLVVLVRIGLLVYLLLLLLVVVVVMDGGGGRRREGRLPGAHRARQRVLADGLPIVLQVRVLCCRRCLILVMVVELLLLLLLMDCRRRRQRALPAGGTVCLSVHSCRSDYVFFKKLLQFIVYLSESQVN